MNSPQDQCPKSPLQALKDGLQQAARTPALRTASAQDQSRHLRTRSVEANIQHQCKTCQLIQTLQLMTIYVS